MTNEEELRIITLLMQNRRFDQSIDSFSRMMQPKFKIPHTELSKLLNDYHQFGYISSTTKAIDNRLADYQRELIEKVNKEKEEKAKAKIHQDNTEDIARYQRKTKKLPLILSIFATNIAFVGLLITLFKPTENVELMEEVEELKKEIRQLKKKAITNDELISTLALFRFNIDI